MPRNSTDPNERTKVFDAFVAVDSDQDVVFHWADGSLTPDERQALTLLLSQLGYFGRAESWCSARLLTEFDVGKVNCRPGAIAAGHEAVRVLGLDAKNWKGPWAFTTRTPPDPPWNLLAETADIHAPNEKWSDPPGSRWWTYARPSGCFATKAHIRRPRTAGDQTHFTVARFIVDVAEGKRPLPLFTDVVPFAEAARAAVMGCYQRLLHRREYGTAHKPYREEFHSETFSGKLATGEYLKSHGHAFYLPTAEERDGSRIDHLTIYAPDGFTRDEVAALDGVRSLRFREADYRLLLTGLGTPENFTCPLFAASHTWVSISPFIATRHLRQRGTRAFFDPEGLTAFVRANLIENWGQRDDLKQKSPGPPEVVPLHDPLAAGKMAFRPLQFRRGRSRPGDDGWSRAFGAFGLKFPTPVSGPVCMGYACHFGLGLFVPADTEVSSWAERPSSS